MPSTNRSFRLDAEANDALERLAAGGMNQSELVRRLLIEAASPRPAPRNLEQLGAEFSALSNAVFDWLTKNEGEPLVAELAETLGRLLLGRADSLRAGSPA